MAEIVLQYIVNQRGSAPTGLRVAADGTVSRPAADSAPPGPTARLDVERPDVVWVDIGHIGVEGVESVREALRANRFFELPARLLINYCKEDPPAAIWTATLDGKTTRVTVFDPRPKRSAEIDGLLAALQRITGG